MEDTLRDLLVKVGVTWLYVLILVLMEDTLRVVSDLSEDNRMKLS